MKQLLFAVVMGAGILAAAGELIFHVSFDHDSIHPDSAAGTKTAHNNSGIGFANKKTVGINGKGSAIILDKSMAAKWYVNKNLNQKQGTVSLWISPVNWQVSGKSRHLFFQANMRDFDLRLMRDQNSDERIIFRITAAGFAGKNKTYFATAKIADWQPGSWHKVDLVWDETFMRIFIDGTLQPYAPAVKGKGAVYCTTKFPAGTAFPEKTLFGGISLNVPEKLNPGEKTAFDELKIYNYPMTPEEVRENYLKDTAR